MEGGILMISQQGAIVSMTASTPEEFEARLTELVALRMDGWVQPVTLRLRGGEYILRRTIKIGSSHGRLTVEPWPGETVTLCGGRKIDGFSKTVFHGVECFGAYLPEVQNGSWNFTDLYVDGLRADLTRYPEQGELKIREAENQGTGLWDSSSWFRANPEDLAGVENIEDCIVSFCHFWIDEHSPVKSYDPETGILQMAYRSRFTMNGNCPYYLENVPGSFAHPNQWYLDRVAGMLYYIPRDDSQRPETISVYAPTISAWIAVEGTEGGAPVENVTIRGLHMTCTRGDYASVLGVNGECDGNSYASDPQAVANAGGSLIFRHAHGCALEGCKLTNFGVHGIVIEPGCHNIRMENNDLYDGGAGGIRMTGGAVNEPEARNTYGNHIVGNRILHCGRRYLSACGILLIHTYENTVSHNEIGDLFYTGISCGWVWGYLPSKTRDNRICKNHIHDIGQGRLSDMGGIYLLGTQPGTVVSGNLIHDIRSRDYGGWALYTDEGSQMILLEKNVCYRVSDNCYHQHYGAYNTVRNNVFAFSGGALLAVTRLEDHLSILFENNVLYADQTPVYAVSKGHITEPGHLMGANNLVFDCRRESPQWCEGFDGGAPLSLEDMQYYGMEQGSVVADPCFCNPAQGDFTFRSDSPALSMGIEPIDLSNVGPQRAPL